MGFLFLFGPKKCEMLKLQPPKSFSSQYHNFKCGEIFCIAPTTYHVCCALCGQKILYQLFPQHFRLQHLSQTNECEILGVDGKLKKKRRREENNDVVEVKLEDDPIKHEDNMNADVDLAQIALFDKEDDIDHNAESHEEFLYEDQYTKVEITIEPATVANSNTGDNIYHNDVGENDNLNMSSEHRIQTRSKRSIRNNTTMPTTSNHLKKHENNDTKLIIDENPASTEIEGVDDIDADAEWTNDAYSEDDSDDEPNKKDEKDLPFPCLYCERRYAIKRSLQCHMRNKHNPDKKNIVLPRIKNKNKELPKEYKCDECDKVCRSERELKGHRWKHTGIFCDICGKPFTQTGNMIRHRVRHTGIKSHKCSECDASFYTDKELKSHSICHTGRMPVICEICGRPCRDRGVLTAHMRRHTGERPAKCEHCGKCFYSYHDLNVHAVTHSNERPFGCDICGSTFQRKKALRVHRLLHSSERKYACKICGKTFAQSGGLNAHLRTHDAASAKAAAAIASNVDNETMIATTTSSLRSSSSKVIDVDDAMEPAVVDEVPEVESDVAITIEQWVDEEELDEF